MLFGRKKQFKSGTLPILLNKMIIYDAVVC